MIRSAFALLALPLAAFPAPAETAGRSYDLHGFSQVAASGCDDVAITAGAAFAVAARGDPRAIDALRLSVRDGTLHVDRAPHSCSGHVPHATVTVAMPRIERVAIAGTGDMRVEGARGAAFAATLSGTGDLWLAAAAVNRATIDLSGTGNVHATGTAPALDLSLSGTGDIDARGLQAEALTVSDSGTGDVAARAAHTAHISASGTGHVTILGHPSCSIHRSGLGSVTCG